MPNVGGPATRRCAFLTISVCQSQKLALWKDSLNNAPRKPSHSLEGWLSAAFGLDGRSLLRRHLGWSKIPRSSGGMVRAPLAPPPVAAAGGLPTPRGTRSFDAPRHRPKADLYHPCPRASKWISTIGRGESAETGDSQGLTYGSNKKQSKKTRAWQPARVACRVLRALRMEWPTISVSRSRNPDH